MVWYGFCRFIIESLRTDSLMFNNFKVAQIVSLLSIFIGLLLVFKYIKKSKFENRYDDYELDDVMF